MIKNTKTTRIEIQRKKDPIFLTKLPIQKLDGKQIFYSSRRLNRLKDQKKSRIITSQITRPEREKKTRGRLLYGMFFSTDKRIIGLYF
jgi:hypothetical protein